MDQSQPPPEGTPPLEPALLAYLAGLLDACGIFRVRETQDGTQLPVVALHGLPTPVLDLVAKHTGTKVTVTRRNYHRLACTEHCPEQHQHVHSVSGRWSVTGARATVMLAALRPYLHVQTAEADAVLEVGKNAPSKPGTAAKMAALGWPTLV